MATVHFRGIPDTLEAYDRMNCASWGLYSGKQFMMACAADSEEEGRQMLEDMLSKLNRSGSTGTYTLCFYNKVGAGQDIDSGTKFNSSFNFRLVDRDDDRYSNQGGALDRRLAGIEAMLSKGTKEPEPNTIAQVADYVENNEWAQRLISGIAVKYLGIQEMNLLQQQQQQRPMHMAGVNDDSGIAAAIVILKTRDAKLGEHLTKLAKLDDFTFNYLMDQLDKIP